MGLFKPGTTTLGLKTQRFDLSPDVYINVRELSAPELIHYQQVMGSKETTNADFLFDIVARCAVDDVGKPLFETAELVKQHFNVGISTLVEMQKVIMSLSGLTEPKN
jgi:hypothetical protein